MSDDHPTELEEGRGGGFLSRWSQRKRESAATPETVPVVLEAEPEVVDAPPLTDADMPPIDSLDEQSDYSGFLSPGVSRELRQLALRKLFRAASFNITDGLDDYDEDFTSFAKLGDIVTREMRVREAADLVREQAKATLVTPESAPDLDIDAPTKPAGAAGTAPSVADGAPATGDDPQLKARTHADPDTTNDVDPTLEAEPHEQPIQPA